MMTTLRLHSDSCTASDTILGGIHKISGGSNYNLIQECDWSNRNLSKATQAPQQIMGVKQFMHLLSDYLRSHTAKPLVMIGWTKGSNKTTEFIVALNIN